MAKKILNILETTILIISCFLCIFVLLQKFVLKENGLFGYKTFVIVTSSMQPSLEIGDVILIKKINPDKIKIGDIITYQGMESDFKNKIITHKVKDIGIEEEKKIFYTQGTTNTMVDPAVYEEQILGKLVYKFKFISLMSKIVRSKTGYILLVFIPLIFIFVREMIKFKKNLN